MADGLEAPSRRLLELVRDVGRLGRARACGKELFEERPRPKEVEQSRREEEALVIGYRFVSGSAASHVQTTNCSRCATTSMIRCALVTFGLTHHDPSSKSLDLGGQSLVLSARK